MSFLLRILAGSLGPYIAIGVAALLALTLAGAQVQTWRLHHVKADLTAARAALVNPATRKTWQSEATACHASLSGLETATAAHNATVEAEKRQSEARAAMLTQALQGARKTASAADARAGRFEAYIPKGADLCTRLLDADRQIDGGYQ